MSPYPIHEEGVVIFAQALSTFISQTPYDGNPITVKILTNSSIYIGSDGVATIPDLQTTITQRGPGLLPGNIPYLVGESGFSSYEKSMKEKLIKLTDEKESVMLVFIISIKEKTRPEDIEAERALQAREELTAMDFRAPDEPCFGPVIVGGVNWISIREISYSMYMRGSDGKFRFDSDADNPDFARGVSINTHRIYTI
jgi:hypothetical protein